MCVCCSVHIVMGEDLVVHAGRDGGLKTMEVQGILKLRISDPDYGFIKVQVSGGVVRGAATITVLAADGSCYD